MWRGNAPRTGVQAQPGPAPSGQVQWQFVNGAGFIASPIAAGDSLYVGDTKDGCTVYTAAMVMSSGNSRSWAR
jgi:putative pyrroloquinoline-quinone-binding quinoprotein